MHPKPSFLDKDPQPLRAVAWGSWGLDLGAGSEVGPLLLWTLQCHLCPTWCPPEQQSSHTRALEGSFSFGAKLTALGEMPMWGRQGSIHLAAHVSKTRRQVSAAVKTPHNQKVSSNSCALTPLPKVKVPEIDLHCGKEQEVTSETFCSKCKSLLKAGAWGTLHFFWIKPYCLQTSVFPSIKYKSSGSRFLITINRGCPSQMDFNTLLLNDCEEGNWGACTVLFI